MSDLGAATRSAIRNACVAGGWCSVAPTTTATDPVPGCRRHQRAARRQRRTRSTRHWPRSTTPSPAGVEEVGAPAVSARRRRRWPDGSATSAATSRHRSCRCCSATPSIGSTFANCCSSRRCCSAIEPDLHLVTLLVELNKLLPDATRATARQVVAQVVEQIEQRLASRTKQAVHGALARSQRSRRPRLSDIDWGHTIYANLRHYLPEQRTVVPERLVGYGRRQRSLSRDVIVAIDQSGSMADSVVYAAVFGAVLASMPALRTSVDRLRLRGRRPDAAAARSGRRVVRCAIGWRHRHRPGDRLLPAAGHPAGRHGAGAGQRPVRRRQHGAAARPCRRAQPRRRRRCWCCWRSATRARPAYDHAQAAMFAELGVPSLACTPDAFPDLLAAALEHRDVGRWANEHGLHTAVPCSDSRPAPVGTSRR